MGLLNAVLILANTTILVSGQFLWKFGLMHNPPSFTSVGNIIKMFFNPFILSGLVMYGMATVLWLYILTRVPLSIAYPLQSIAYILAVFGAFFVFDEPLTIFKVIGVLLIVAGVSMVGIAGNQI